MIRGCRRRCSDPRTVRCGQKSGAVMTDMRGVISVGLQLVGGTVRHMPLANEVLPRLADVERTLVRTMRQHLDAVDPAPQTQLAIADEPAPPTTPALLLRGLLDRSMYTSPDDSRDALYLSLLQALVQIGRAHV